MPQERQEDVLSEPLPQLSGPSDTHYTMVLKALVEGRVVPFLGAGVNLWCRSPLDTWQCGKDLPSGMQLTGYLVKEFGYPEKDSSDLLRVSEYAAVMMGSGPLYEKLRALFDVDYPPTPLHEFFAQLPKRLKNKGHPPKYQLFITTNYDDVLERAFQIAEEPFDVVTYIADGDNRGRFVHRLPDGELRLIALPNEYVALPIEMPSLLLKRSLILKIHGTVDRNESDWDSYVITEDHYIDYLTRTDISTLMPKALVAKLKRSHFLFLGYSLRDWNLRAILHRISMEAQRTYRSWAIQKDADPLEQKFWLKRDVDIYSESLESYIAALSQRIQDFPDAATTS